MLIVDSQVHIWEPNRPDRPWDTAREPHHPEPFTAERLLARMDEGGVDRAVIVTPSISGYHNEYALESAQRWPHRLAVMGRIDIAAADTPARLETWLSAPGMLGVRLLLTPQPWRGWLEDGSLEWFWPAAERLGIPVAVHVHRLQHHIDRVATRYPGLRLLIDHLALPIEDVADPWEHLGETLALAKHPNVYAKVSSLPRYSREPYPFRDLHEPIRRVYDAFGPQRMLWGTDITRLRCSFREAANLIAEACTFLDDEDREWILGRATLETLRWPA